MKKNIALIAHDHKKSELINWVVKHKTELSKHNLCGTGTTATKVNEATGLAVYKFLSGPLGGDQQIGAAIVEGKVDMLIFFWDPLSSQPHDPDVKALLRVAVLKDIPIATNVATANLLLKSCEESNE